MATLRKILKITIESFQKIKKIKEPLSTHVSMCLEANIPQLLPIFGNSINVIINFHLSPFEVSTFSESKAYFL